MDSSLSPKPPPRPGAPPPPPAAPPAPRPKGTDAAALAELRNAAATYDYLRRKGDPVQFWEMLRLARSRRAIVAPADGEAVAPAPEIEAAILHELGSLRRQFAPLVRDLRRFLRKVKGVPDPVDRFEMALAFLLASAREHQAVAKWLAEPDKHEAKAVEKLRSLAAITDPYREALQPWTLQVDEREHETSVRTRPAAPAQKPASGLDPQHVELIRRAAECREILSGVHLDSELWETLLLTTMEPEITRGSMEKLMRELEDGLLDELQTDAEALFARVAELRQKYAGWVRSVNRCLVTRRLAPGNPRAFELGLGLMLTAPGARDRLNSWVEYPESWQEEAVGLLGPWMVRARDYLGELKAFGL